MQIGIHVNTFHRHTLDETLDAVVEQGLDCVHFNMSVADMPSMPEEVDDETCQQIVEALESRSISVASLSGTFNMIHPSVDTRRAGLRRLDAIASVAPRIGAPLIALCTGTRDPDDMWRGHVDNDTPEAWDDMVGSMTEALDIARRHDVALGIEPEVSNVVDTARKARRLLDEMNSPRLKIIIDGANLFHEGELPRMRAILDEAFDLLGPDIAMAHAKDLARDGRPGHVPAGKGALDFDHYVRRLSQAGFDGPIVLHSLSEDDVPGCIEFLRGLLAEEA